MSNDQTPAPAARAGHPLEPGERDGLSERVGLLRFGAASATGPGLGPVGFGWLGVDGTLTERPSELWITCRMTHVFGLASLLGEYERSASLAEYGIDALRNDFRDPLGGGWFASVERDDGGRVRPVDASKQAYGHAFVVLAAATGAVAGIAGAAELLDDALAVLTENFDDPASPGGVLVADTYPRSDYRGINANMHLLEALLAAHDALTILGRPDPNLLNRAETIVAVVVHSIAREHGFRIPEHFDPAWNPLPDYNRENPADPFRPFGATVGHGFEWARLALDLRAALLAARRPIPDWIVPDAAAVYARARADGWDAGKAAGAETGSGNLGGGSEGFCYTTDFAGNPVVRDRMHWVVAEAITAAWALGEVSGSAGGGGDYRADYARFGEHARSRFVDSVGGSWWHQLDPANAPSFTVWPGKPDIYHVYQALLRPILPPAGSYIGAAWLLAGEGAATRG